MQSEWFVRCGDLCSHSPAMQCSRCGSEMDRVQLEAVLGGMVEIDVCVRCHGFWFDSFETLKLAPGATLTLFELISRASAHTASSSSLPMRCPRCGDLLRRSRDRQRNTPFEYDSCPKGHGRFERFHDFLKEKNFIQPLTTAQLLELRRNVRMVHCSNCGAPVDVVRHSTCDHCGSPLMMIDREAMARVASQYHAAEKKKISLPPMPPAQFQDGHSSPLNFDLRAFGNWLLEVLMKPPR
jgi:Zn-finger nucleic acid-binding protein